MHFAQKTNPDGEAVGSCGAIRQAGHTPDGPHVVVPGGNGGNGGGGGTMYLGRNRGKNGKWNCRPLSNSFWNQRVYSCSTQ